MALTERLQILIDAQAGGAIAEFKRVQGATQGLNAAAAGGARSLGGLGQAGAAAGGMLQAGLVTGVTAAWTAIIGFGISSVKAFNDLGQEVLKFQRASGATAEEASALVAAFDDMGIEAETGSKAIFQLGKRLETSKAALASVGVTAVKNSAGNVDLAATLTAVADAYVNTADQGERNALVAAAFGKAGQELVPILEKGSAGIKELYASAAATGQILSQDDIAKAENFRIAMDDLDDSFRALSLAAGELLVPALTKIVDTFLGLIEKGREFSELPVVKQARGLFGEIFKGATGGMFEAADGLGTVARATTQAAVDAAEFDKELDALTKTLFSAESASRALADAQGSLDDAHLKLTDATADYNQLLKDGAVDEEKVADARTSLADATRSLADANRGVAKAQKEYDKAVAGAAALGGLDSAMDKVADAGENLADAQDTQASASERAAEAAQNLREAQAGDPEYQKKLADARRDVKAATDGVADAEYRLGQRSYENVIAHDAETEAISGKADQVERLKADLEAMLKLNPALFPFLGPLLAGLPTAGPGPGPSPLAGGGLLPGLSLLNTPGGASSTTNNVTVNATATEADARLIAKEVMWNLN